MCIRDRHYRQARVLNAQFGGRAHKGDDLMARGQRLLHHMLARAPGGAKGCNPHCCTSTGLNAGANCAAHWLTLVICTGNFSSTGAISTQVAMRSRFSSWNL